MVVAHAKIVFARVKIQETLGGEMKVFIKTASGKISEYEFDGLTSVVDLKQKITNSEGELNFYFPSFSFL